VRTDSVVYVEQLPTVALDDPPIVGHWDPEDAQVASVARGNRLGQAFAARHMVEVERLAPPGDLEAAIAWGRERAPVVLVCPVPGLNEYFSAGEEDPEGLGIPRWTGWNSQGSGKTFAITGEVGYTPYSSERISSEPGAHPSSNGD
jgi:hypothetical protein